MSAVENLPGFRRRFRITPTANRITCELEDDFHCMTVEIHHDRVTATDVVADMKRAPWTTCPGAEQQLRDTFTGVRLDDFTQRGQKKANCTHLFDLALIAAGHAHDETLSVYDIAVSDPVEDKCDAELRVGDEVVVSWTEVNSEVISPARFKGMKLMGNITPWLEQSTPEQQEAIRLLRWANMISHGRRIPLEQQSDATRMPPNCYTFQPQRAVIAQRVGIIKDFSSGELEPLEKS